VAEVDPPLPALTVPQLCYLVAAVDQPTFSAAAETLGVTTSALSQGLAELERRIGLELFERSGRRQVLRPEATEVLAYARRVLADTGDLARWAAAMRSGEIGRLRVGMIDAAALHHFPDVLRAFRDDHPGVDLRLTVGPSGQLLDQLERGALDLAVVVDPPGPHAGLNLEPLVDEPLVVVAPDDTPAAAVDDPARWGPWVLFPEGSNTRSVIERELRARGSAVAVVAESHQPEVLREMARLGVGWTVLPTSMLGPSGRARSASRRGRATASPEGPTLTTRHLVLAGRSGRPTNPAADALANGLRGSSDPGRG
jgi:DNA-binding transcriptional LysR family regulator